MKLLLVDDKRADLERLQESCLSALPGNEVLTYTSPEKAFADTEGMHIDIAFLDIYMPRMDGIQLARKLKQRDSSTRVVFVTAHEGHALEAYRVHASGFIVKPVDEEKIQAETSEFAKTDSAKAPKAIQVKCFGHFEIFHDGVPLKFKRSKSKELLAYLVDREGYPIGQNELCDILWGEENMSYLRNLVSDIRNTLGVIGCSDIFIKKGDTYSIDVTKIDCDAYELKNENPDAIRMYRGQYMYQYSWAMFVDE